MPYRLLETNRISEKRKENYPLRLNFTIDGKLRSGQFFLVFSRILYKNEKNLVQTVLLGKILNVGRHHLQVERIGNAD